MIKAEQRHPRSNDRPFIVLLVGPTAVGKTEASLRLAADLDAEIVSLDSRLFYRGMDIGTAKPSAEARSRVPHHLIDIAEPDESLSLAVFQQMAHHCISDILGRGRLPLLVGGSGQYVRAIAAGWSPPAVSPNPRLRQELSLLASSKGELWLHERLRGLDPNAAASIDARNIRRTVRALEVILTTGYAFSVQRQRGPSPYRILTIGLRRPRPELYKRIDARIDDMWDRGLVEETRRLLSRGFSPQLPAMSAIGYAQCISVIAGELTPEHAKAEIRRATRALVRRQANWFKESDPDILWFDADKSGTIDAIETIVAQERSRHKPD